MESVFCVLSEKNRAKNIQFIYFTVYLCPWVKLSVKKKWTKSLDQICKWG